MTSWWEQLSYDGQTEYLREHPNSGRELTRRPGKRTVGEQAKRAMSYLKKSSSAFVAKASETARSAELLPLFSTRPGALSSPGKTMLTGLFHAAMATSYVAAVLLGGDSPLGMIGQIAKNATDYFARKLGKEPIFDEDDELAVDGSKKSRFSDDERNAFNTANASGKEPLEKVLAMLFHYLSLPEAQAEIAKWKHAQPS